MYFWLQYVSGYIMTSTWYQSLRWLRRCVGVILSEWFCDMPRSLTQVIIVLGTSWLLAQWIIDDCFDNFSNEKFSTMEVKFYYIGDKKKNNVVCNILVTFVALKILLAAGIFLRAVLKFVFVLALVSALFS